MTGRAEKELITLRPDPTYPGRPTPNPDPRRTRPVDFQSLNFLAQKIEGAKPELRIVDPDTEPNGWYYVVRSDGEMVLTQAKPAPKNHQAADLETVVAQAVAGLAGPGAPHPEIWYGREAVVALVVGSGIDGGASRAAFALSPSPQLATLTEWDRAKRFEIDQRALILLLRTLFADCLGQCPDLIDAVRNVRTQRAADVNKQVQHGKVSLGKTELAEMTGLKALPEAITLTVPVWAQTAAPWRAPVRVAIDPDPEREVFKLVVLPGEIEAAYWLAEQRLAMRLAELLGEHGPGKGDAVPVYHGRP